MAKVYKVAGRFWDGSRLYEDGDLVTLPDGMKPSRNMVDPETNTPVSIEPVGAATGATLVGSQALALPVGAPNPLAARIAELEAKLAELESGKGSSGRKASKSTDTSKSDEAATDDSAKADETAKTEA